MHKKYISCFVIMSALAMSNSLLAYVMPKENLNTLARKNKEEIDLLSRAADGLKKARSLDEVYQVLSDIDHGQYDGIKTKLCAVLDGDLVASSEKLGFREGNFLFLRSLSGEYFYDKISQAAQISRINGGHPVGIEFWADIDGNKVFERVLMVPGTVIGDVTIVSREVVQNRNFSHRK